MIEYDSLSSVNISPTLYINYYLYFGRCQHFYLFTEQTKGRNFIGPTMPTLPLVSDRMYMYNMILWHKLPCNAILVPTLVYIFVF